MSKDRKPLSKRTRFEVFKRDGFICQYCGNTPPAVVLEVDHIIPVSAGGKSTEDNLITACFDCNRGKGAKDLSSIPESFDSRTAELQEREAQIAGYEALLKRRRARENRTIRVAEKLFKETFGRGFNDRFKASMRSSFLPHLAADEIEEAAEIACSRIASIEPAIKYFCGICWKKIRAKGIE